MWVEAPQSAAADKNVVVGDGMVAKTAAADKARQLGVQTVAPEHSSSRPERWDQIASSPCEQEVAKILSAPILPVPSCLKTVRLALRLVK